MKDFLGQFLDQIDHYNQVVDDYKEAVDSAPDHALAFVNWGIKLAREGQMGEALQKFEKAVTMAPERPECYTNWGVALAKMNRLDEAIEKFKKATELSPENTSNFILWGAALVEKGEAEAAQKKYECAIKITPNDPEPFANWGIALARVGEYHGAIKQFKAALALRRYQPNVYFLWGVVLAELEDYQGAIEKFKTTLRYIPKHAEATYFLGVALNRMGEYEEAIEVSREALILNAHRPEVYMNLGDALANTDKLDVAIANYRHALMLDPNLAEAYKSWGIALIKSGKPDEGFKKFEKALALTPELSDVFAQWGSALVKLQRYKEALPYLDKAHIADPDNADILLDWSLALIRLGTTDLALDKLFEVEELERWNPNVHYLLGTHYLGLEDYEKAIDHLKKTLAEDPDFEDAAINLALAYCETGNSQEAIRAVRPVIRKSPDSPKANFFYGNILYRCADPTGWKDAITRLMRSIELAEAQKITYPEPHIALGEIYLKQDKYQDAQHRLEEAIKLDPQCIPALYLLSLARFRQGQTEHSTPLLSNALESVEKALTLMPHHLEALALRAYLLGTLKGIKADKNHTEETVQHVTKAFESLMKNENEALTLELDAPSKGLLLFYESKALQELGDLEKSRAKYKEALQLAPHAETQYDTVFFKS